MLEWPEDLLPYDAMKWPWAWQAGMKIASVLLAGKILGHTYRRVVTHIHIPYIPTLQTMVVPSSFTNACHCCQSGSNVLQSCASSVREGHMPPQTE